VADEVRDVDGRPDRSQRVEVLRERLPAKIEAGAMPPAQPRTISCWSARSGSCENEHIPTTSVVTPWRTFDSADGHAK